jgi:D-ribulokinase
MMDSQNQPVVIGLDVGTSGVRCVAVLARGEVIAGARAPVSDLYAPGSAHEQDPGAWWRAVCQTLREVKGKLDSGAGRPEIAGIAVTSTSSSLVLVDADGEPVRPAMLYDDGRAGAAAAELNAQLPAGEAPINASFSLAKALWVSQFEPSVWRRTAHILHPADWLTARLTGTFGVSDYSNALKLGYEFERGGWIGAVGRSGIPASMLPRVVAPGDQVGVISRQAAEQKGLRQGIPVLAGASDGLASFVGSGASKPGHANTTLGTTLVWKVLSAETPRLGPGMYCHHLPGALRIPGAASNTGPGSLRYDYPGPGSIRSDYPGPGDYPGSGSLRHDYPASSTPEVARPHRSPHDMDRDASASLPTSVQCYLLGSRGERFPFFNPKAEAFFEGHPESPEEAHAAQLQSLACVERWGYERLEGSGTAVGNEVYSAGSAATSPVYSQLRANVLNRHVLRTATPTASFGAAILAAATVFYAGDLAAAMSAMTHVVESHAPQSDAVDRFAAAYQAFRSACSLHGLG